MKETQAILIAIFALIAALFLFICYMMGDIRDLLIELVEKGI